MSGKHYEGCPGKVQKFYHGTNGTGRKKVNVIVMLDEWTICDCWCHKKEEPKKRKKKSK